MEHQALGLAVGEVIHIDVQPLFACLFPHALGIDTAAIVTERHHVIRALFAHIDADHTGVRLAGRNALCRGFDAVIQRVAHHVLENDLAAGVAVAVELAGLADHPEHHRLAQFRADRAHDAAQPGHQP